MTETSQQNTSEPQPGPSGSVATGASKTQRILLIGALVAALGAFAFLATGDIGDNLIYYWSPTELIAAADKADGASIRLGGLVEAGSVQFSDDGLTIDFSVTDGESSVPVRTTAVPPAMFREGIGVVLEGTLTSAGTFETQRLMVKHDNEYQAPETEDDRTMEDLVRTMQFDRADT